MNKAIEMCYKMRGLIKRSWMLGMCCLTMAREAAVVANDLKYEVSLEPGWVLLPIRENGSLAKRYKKAYTIKEDRCITNNILNK